eukprot:300038-Prymnesium_polylepis.1
MIVPSSKLEKRGGAGGHAERTSAARIGVSTRRFCMRSRAPPKRLDAKLQSDKGDADEKRHEDTC